MVVEEDLRRSQRNMNGMRLGTKKRTSRPKFLHVFVFPKLGGFLVVKIHRELPNVLGWILSFPVTIFSTKIQPMDVGMSKNGVYPQLSPFSRDNDQQNHWV